MLSGLQERIARILAALPEAREFALAGGAALIAGGLVERETRDLDFFADRPGAVLDLLQVLEEALRQSGMQVERQQALAGFARLGVSDGTESTEVDLCYDVRVRPAETSALGAVLAPEELAADKMLAFFSRALPRDLIDLHALAQRFGFDRLCELAAEKDRGFNLPTGNPFGSFWPGPTVSVAGSWRPNLNIPPDPTLAVPRNRQAVARPRDLRKGRSFAD